MRQLHKRKDYKKQLLPQNFKTYKERIAQTEVEFIDDSNFLNELTTRKVKEIESLNEQIEL